MGLESYTFLIDHVGMIVWIFLIWISIVDLKNKKLEKWPRFVVLGIGIIGISMDGFLLYLGYIKSNLESIAPLFDHFGIPVFLFLIWLSCKDLKNKFVSRKMYTKIIFLVLSVGGLIADGFILANYWF